MKSATYMALLAWLGIATTNLVKAVQLTAEEEEGDHDDGELDAAEGTYSGYSGVTRAPTKHSYDYSGRDNNYRYDFDDDDYDFGYEGVYGGRDYNTFGGRDGYGELPYGFSNGLDGECRTCGVGSYGDAYSCDFPRLRDVRLVKPADVG